MIKKIVYRLLCNNATGALILSVFGKRVPNLRWKSYAFNVSGARINKTIAASVFWGFYEGAEVRFVEKYFKGDVDAVELGASSGIVSSHIISKFTSKDRRLVSVEANAMLESIWRDNVGRHNRNGAGVSLLNNAIHYDARSVKFLVSGNTTESRLSRNPEQQTNSVEVSATTLGEIVRTRGLREYAMFCDIEGAEAEIFLNEDQATFDKCKYIFIELHDTTYKEVHYGTNDLSEVIKKKGFVLVDRHGPVHYYKKESEI